MNNNDRKSFWNTLPGLLTAIAGLITAVAGIIAISVNFPRPNVFFPATESPATMEPSPPLKPELVLKKTEERETNGINLVEYRLAIKNWHLFQRELFEPAPYLPPCGLNENSSRTWVDIYNGETDEYIYGFCGFSEPEDLQSFWFAVRKDTEPPDTVYVVLNDRRDEILYTSDPIAIK